MSSAENGCNPTLFLFYLDFKEGKLIDLFKELRSFILALYPESNEILYHTHALSSVFSISEKLSDAYCMINIYSNSPRRL